MQRWFYANEELICEKTKTPDSTERESVGVSELFRKPLLRTWRFCVTLKDRELLPNEVVAISGDCDALGNWELDSCVRMIPIHEDKPDVWQVYVNIPAERDVAYRYLIIAIDPEKDQTIVRYFESHLQPRKVTAKSDVVVDICDDIFGFVEKIEKVDRGWLTTERIVQFMFFNSPFKWGQPELAECTFHVKVTPFFRKKSNKCDKENIKEDLSSYVQSLYGDIDNVSGEQIEEIEIDNTGIKKDKEPTQCGTQIPSYTKLDFCDNEYVQSRHSEDSSSKNCISTEDTSQNKQDGVKLSTAFAFNEVANYFEYKSVLQQQPRFGTQSGKDDLVTVHLTISDFENTAYRIELFLYNKNITKTEYPHLLGYRYVEPEDFEIYKHGYIEAPIICASKHRQIGSMRIRFLIILPHETLKFNLSTSYIRHWNKKHAAIDVGHRGQGRSYNASDNNIVYENTLYSMNKAIENGAKMIEFDVHLTKDLIPVIYHDFMVHVAPGNSTLLQNFNYIKIPINTYDYKELLNLKFPSSNAEPNPTRISNAKESQQIFPRLSHVLEALNENVGFDIEIKWPQQYANCTWDEGVHPSIDPNIYVDRILETVVPQAKKRRIVFSCFDADICLLLRYKQNIYPVMFLVRHEHGGIPYSDPRTRPMLTSVNFAYAMELLGVVPHAKALLESPSFIGKYCERKFAVFSYGVENHQNIEKLKEYGVSAVIFDRMDKFAQSRKIPSEGLGGGDE